MKLSFIAALFVCALTGTAYAQSWPDRPIRFIAAFPAGGGVDIVARTVAPALSTRIGQPIVVENRSGAAGVLGSAVVAMAPADGYTVLVTSNPSITIAAAEEQKRGYDPLKDLRPVVKATAAPTVIVTAVTQQPPAKAGGLRSQALKVHHTRVDFTTRLLRAAPP